MALHYNWLVRGLETTMRSHYNLLVCKQGVYEHVATAHNFLMAPTTTELMAEAP